MKKEDHTALIQKVRSAMPEGSNLAEVTEALTTLSDDYGAVVAELEATKTTASVVSKDNEALREVNMRLFLKVGGEPPKETKAQEDDRMKFEDLFNEKGGLK